MSDYNKATNFTAKDSLPTGNAGKIVKGAEIDTEFTAIASAIASKADSNSPAFTGTPVAPTASSVTNTTQVATTAFVQAVVTALDLDTMSTQAASAVAITGGTLNGVTGTNSGMTVGTATNATNSTNATNATNASNATSGSTLEKQVVKAWVRYNGVTQTIVSSYNVASVDYNGVGDYTINFSTAMPDANYSYSLACGGTDINTGSINVIGRNTNNALTASSIRVYTRYQDASFGAQQNLPEVCVQVFSL